MHWTIELGPCLSSDKGNPQKALAAKIPRLIMVSVLFLSSMAPAQTYRVLKSFAKGDDGGYPEAGLFLVGKTLYGTTRGNGTLVNGGVFRVNTDGSGYAVLRTFRGTDSLNGPLILEGTTLYGSDFWGAYGSGEIFKVGTDGTGYTVVFTFLRIGAWGTCPVGNLVLVGDTLYGTTAWGGDNSSGTVFKVSADGSRYYRQLKSFSFSDGYNPGAGPILAGNTLYGTTIEGGSPNRGVVFKVNTDGSDFAVLKNFTGSDGSSPRASLVEAAGTLYGTTESGGSANLGVVFKVNTDGSAFAVLKHFTGSDGSYPVASLVEAGGTLYGTTWKGGSADNGVVFKISTAGSGYKVLKKFTGSDGSRPWANLVVAGNTLYGTTSQGGSAGAGVVFSLTYHLSIKIPPSTQTAEAGSTVQFAVQADGPEWVLDYQWFFNGTNALASATNTSLKLTNIQPVQAGNYHVVVTGMGLAVTSPPALLSVIPPVNKRIVPALILPGGTGDLLHIEYADSVAVRQWLSLSNVTLSSGPQFCFDLCQSPPPQRFYRAWQTSGVQSTLNATMATEIPVTGLIGSSLRVDYIKAIGPTDAWVTLTTVLITNAPQLYYDLTALGQPARLYRLVPVP